MNELDVVLLEDGREGTIVFLYSDGKTAVVETDNNELITVKLSTLKPITE